MSNFFPHQQKPPSEGYPLPSIDANGTAICAGDSVRIISIPNWLTHDIPADEAEQLKSLENNVLKIFEIDSDGMIWFGEEDPWFCVTPIDVIRTTEHDSASESPAR